MADFNDRPKLSSLKTILNKQDHESIRKFANHLQQAKKIRNLGTNQLLEIPERSEVWVVTAQGLKLRKVCGFRGSRGMCFLPAGWGTQHVGYGHCVHHASKALLNPIISREHNYPTRLVELIEHADHLENEDLVSVDNEIRILYALQQYLMTSPIELENFQLNPQEIQLIKDITMDIVKTKSIKVKINREMQLDATSVKKFIDQIFGLLVERLPAQEARFIMSEITNKVIVPLRTRDRVMPGEVDPARRIESHLKKAGVEVSNGGDDD